MKLGCLPRALRVLRSPLTRHCCSEATSQWKTRSIAVTGAGKGLGRSIADRLLEHGSKVVAISRTETDLRDLSNDHSNPDSLFVIAGDVSNDDFISELAENTALMQCDSLVNCAGISIIDSFLETKIEDYRKVQKVNVEAPLMMSQLLSRQWVTNEVRGNIVNISSSASLSTLANHTAYSASKHALDSLTLTMALELGVYGIRVNSVNPTAVLTPMGRRVWGDPDKARVLLDKIPLQRLVEVSEVVDSVMFLLSEQSSMIHGQRIAIDGGLSGTA